MAYLMDVSKDERGRRGESHVVYYRLKDFF